MAMYRFNHIGFGSSGIARASAFFVLLLLLIGCTGGDDDGRRIGDTIVGTWHRGTNPDDVVIEGDAELDPDALPIQKLIFLGDGSYNGMVRKGSFQALSKDGEITSEGTYQCDNSNLRLEYIDEYSEKQKLGGSGTVALCHGDFWCNHHREHLQAAIAIDLFLFAHLVIVEYKILCDLTKGREIS